jgi:hypothetical protein
MLDLFSFYTSFLTPATSGTGIDGFDLKER